MSQAIDDLYPVSSTIVEHGLEETLADEEPYLFQS